MEKSSNLSNLLITKGIPLLQDLCEFSETHFQKNVAKLSVGNIVTNFYYGLSLKLFYSKYQKKQYEKNSGWTAKSVAGYLILKQQGEGGKTEFILKLQDPFFTECINRFINEKKEPLSIESM